MPTKKVASKTLKPAAGASPIRVRMAPSPTGSLHIGTARTALFNWLFARKHGGVFILRIEDTDKERSKKEYEDELIDGLKWLGLDWDEFGRQSDRTALYRKALEKLLASGEAYYCYCTKEDLEAQRQAMLASGLAWKYNGHCRPESKNKRAADAVPQVIRFKVPEVKIEFPDLIRGKVTFDVSLFGDQPIAKNLDSPLYNFAVVVDDDDMKISHVIRGEEHLSNTPKQILLQRALGLKEPIYAHIPLILNFDRTKMSKRLGNAALLSEYRASGYLPEAIVNFLAMLGWHPKDDREVFDKEGLAKVFELERVQKAGAVFDPNKLDWLNREHMKKYSDAELVTLAKPFIEKKYPAAFKEKSFNDAFLERLISVERSRANTLADFAEMGSFFFALPDYEPALLVWKEAPKSEVAGILREVRDHLQAIEAGEGDDDAFNKENIATALASVIGDRNRGTVLWPLRVAVSGLTSSPDPVDIMIVIGKSESLTRIEIAIKKLSA